MRPSIQRGEPPAFYELDEYTFQRLCNDLLDAEPDVLSSSEYGVRGQTQYGIDLLATLHEGLTCYAVAQCKCYEDFPPAEIKDASDEFFKHQDHWATWQIRRFILMVACDMRTTQRQHTIKAERERFAQDGIRYEAWDATTLQQKLAPRRDIVERHLGPEWVPIICGPTRASAAGNVLYPVPAASALSGSVAGGGVSDVLAQQYLARVIPAHSRERYEQLSSMRMALREGRKDEVQHWLRTVQNDPDWLILQSDVAAQILRFAAAVQLDLYDDHVEATRLVEEAGQRDPASNDRRIRAFIAARTEGVSAALALLADDEDPESRNVYAALLLEQGDADAARTILHSLQEHQQADAETLRLLALIHLLNHEVDQAQLAIQKAQEVAPQWVAIRLVAAIVDYYSTVAPVALPDRLVPWPQPVDWAFIKQDDLSLCCLRDAARNFLDLATSPYPPDSRENLQTWHLACLANDPEHQEEAVDVCKRVLHTNPAEYRAVIWAVNRRFLIDWQPVERALNESITKRRAEAAHVQVLASWYLATNRATKAVQLLKRTQKLFTTVGAEDVWDAWHQQAMVVAATPKQLARLGANSTTTVHRTSHATVLERQAAEDGNLKPLVDYYDQCYTETNDPLWLFQACEAMATAEDWEGLAARVHDLIAHIPTSAVLHLAVLGLYNTGNHSSCLALLEQHHDWFPQGRFPPQIRRIRIACQRAIGILADAIAEAEALYQDEPTTPHLLTLCQAYLDIGDVPMFTLKARHLVQRPDLAPGDGLRVVGLVALTDRQLAIDLWRAMTRNPLTDDLVESAVQLGFQLGLDDELRPFMDHLIQMADAGRGGVRRMTPQDVQAVMDRRHQMFNEVEAAYRSGAWPLHMIANLHQWSLLDLYHRVLTANAAAPDPIHHFSLLVRHGMRTRLLTWNHADRPLRLHLDVTAVLLAAHLDILTVVEQHFAPLRIPTDLIPALLEMWMALEDQQPSTVETAQHIVNLVEQGTIQVLNEQPTDDPSAVLSLGTAWNTLFHQTRQLGGYLVDHLPKRLPTDLDRTIELPDEVAPWVITPRTVVEAMHQHGPFSEQQYLDVLTRLGAEGQEQPSPNLPPPDTPLILAGTIAETLAAAHVLNPLTTHFRVWIEAAECARCRHRLHGDQERRASQNWLRRLLDQMRLGLESSTYEVIPVPIEVVREERANGRLPSEVRCIFTLGRTVLAPGDIVWVDDRSMTSSMQIAGVPIAGILDILFWLHQQQALDDAMLYDKLLHLRAANVRYLPLTTDELLYHLSQARVEDGILLETEALRVVRRSVAACLYQDALLQPPAVNRQGEIMPGELSFVINTTETIRDTLYHAWLSSPDPGIRRARVEWVYTNLYIGSLSTPTLLARMTNAEQRRMLESSDLFQLLLHRESVIDDVQVDLESILEYCAWVATRVLQPRCQADPVLVLALVERYTQLFTELLNVEGPDEGLQLYAKMIYRVLPNAVRIQLRTDLGLMQRLGLRTIFSIGDVDVALPDFFAALPQALAGAAVALQVLGMDRTMQLSVTENPDQGRVFCLTDPETGGQMVIPNPELFLAAPSLIEREAILRRHVAWFDRPPQMVEQIIAHLATLGEVEQRIRAAADWRARSMVALYARLRDQMHARQQVDYSDLLPPSVDEILWHLRIDPTDQSEHREQDDLAAAITALINELGPVGAWERLMSLPLHMPTILLDAMRAMPLPEQRAALRRLLRTTHSPISLLQLIHLVLQLQLPPLVAYRLARRLMMHLLRPTSVVHIEAFLTLLRWVGDAMTERQEVRAWPVAWRLAAIWSHAHHLYQVLLSVPLPPAGIQQIFTNQHQNIGPLIFEPQRDYEQDRAHAAGVALSTLVLDGLTYALGDQMPSVVTAEVQQILADLTFPEMAGQRLPDPALLIITPGIASPFPSFLGSDRTLLICLIVGEELATRVSREELMAGVMLVCERLRDNPQDYGAWEVIQATIGDTRPDPHLREMLDEVIAQTDFAAWAATDRSSSLAGLRTAALQAAYLSIPTRQHLNDMILACMQVLAQRGNQESRGDSEMIARAVHDLSIVEPNPADAIQRFTQIVTQVIEVWPQAGATYRPLVQRIWEVLPSDQSYQLWPLVLRLRAA